MTRRGRPHALEEHARSHGPPRLIAEALRARARLLAATGDLDGADAAIGEAEAIHRRIEDPWELAHTLLVAGDVHRRARRRARARAALREALESFAFLGARLWASRPREQLGTHRCRARAGRTDADPAQGRRARRKRPDESEIADRLFMSAHTVEAHLSAIYRALDINSRSQLERGAVCDGPPPGIRPADPGIRYRHRSSDSRNFALRLQGRCSTQSSSGPSGDRSRSEPMAQATQAGAGNPAGPQLSPRRGWRDPRGHPGRRDPRLRRDRPVRAARALGRIGRSARLSARPGPGGSCSAGSRAATSTR